MKRLLETLLIVLALALCGLCASQWSREQRLRQSIDELKDDQKKKTEKIENLVAANKRFDEQVGALIQKSSELEAASRDQAHNVADMNRKLARAESLANSLTNAVSQLREAVEDRNNKIREANEKIKGLANERNDVVKKSNELVAKSNEIIKKYNELVEGYEKLQSNYNTLRASAEQKK